MTYFYRTGGTWPLGPPGSATVLIGGIVDPPLQSYNQVHYNSVWRVSELNTIGLPN